MTAFGALVPGLSLSKGQGWQVRTSLLQPSSLLQLLLHIWSLKTLGGVLHDRLGMETWYISSCVIILDQCIDWVHVVYCSGAWTSHYHYFPCNAVYWQQLVLKEHVSYWRRKMTRTRRALVVIIMAMGVVPMLFHLHPMSNSTFNHQTSRKRNDTIRWKMVAQHSFFCQKYWHPIGKHTHRLFEQSRLQWRDQIVPSFFLWEVILLEVTIKMSRFTIYR